MYYMRWLTLMNYVSCLHDEGIIEGQTYETMTNYLMDLKGIVMDADEKLDMEKYDENH